MLVNGFQCQGDIITCITCISWPDIQNYQIFQELIKNGFNEFERGDIYVEGSAENEIDYFKEMAESKSVKKKYI